MLGNTKSDRHRKTCEVESGEAGRQSWHLTRGDLPDESLGEVSRGLSPEDAPEKARSEGPKDYETGHFDHLCEEARGCPKRHDVATAAAIGLEEARGGRWIPVWGKFLGSEPKRERRREEKVLNEELMEKVLNPGNMEVAYEHVKANGGAAGVDGMGVEAYAEHAARHWPVIEAKLRAGDYRPGAIRGVNVPKPQGGERRLGIPNVQDRVIQQALLQVLSPIFEGQFSDHSYGYRPGRNAHDAVEAARRLVLEGKDWVVDVDISACFDELDHDILMAKIGRNVRDKRVLKLIGRYLRAPIRQDGHTEQRVRGTPQGGPLSPLLANIYLDTLDKEVERRGLSYCRYADDIAIFVSSERSANRVLAGLMEWIPQHLKLRVNAKKSGVGRPWNGKFLGFRITGDGRIAAAKASLDRLKANVRRAWDAQLSLPLEARIERWQRYIRGWWNYFGLCEQRRPIFALEGWMRRHMRKYFWQRWHNRKGRENALRRLRAKPYHQKQASGSAGAWRVARRPMLQTVLDKARLRRWGLYVPSDFATE